MHRDLSERDKATILMLLTMHLSFLYMPLISKDPRHASNKSAKGKAKATKQRLFVGALFRL